MQLLTLKFANAARNMRVPADLHAAMREEANEQWREYLNTSVEDAKTFLRFQDTRGEA